MCTEYNEENLIEYCRYCKEEVFLNEDYVKYEGDIYHIECWKQEFNIDELNFD